MRVAVVTGSSSGIGRATALRLARDGFAVFLHARQSAEALRSVAQEIEQLTQQPTHFSLADFDNQEARAEFVASAFGWHGRVDVWVNNAGADVLTGQGAKATFLEKLQRLLNVDVIGTVELSRMVADRMTTQGQPTSDKSDEPRSTVSALPMIVNMGWDQATLGMSDDSGQLFCTTKAAVMAFTTSLAMSVAPKIRVNCVAPGWIKTAWGDKASKAWDERARSESLLDRWGNANDIAATISWLASPDAAFVNAQCIAVNGGRRFFN